MSNTVSIGRKGWIGIGFETAVGVGGDTPAKYIPYIASTMKNVVEVLDDEAAKGIRERAWGSVAARTRGEGDITIIADVETLPYFLYPALGACVTQSIEAGSTYQHTLTRKASNPPTTICLNVNDTVETRKYHYGSVSSLELSFSDGFVEVTSSILSKAPVVCSEFESQTPCEAAGCNWNAGVCISNASLSIDEENILAFKDAKIYFGATLTEAEANYQNNTNAKDLTAFTLTINNNSEAQYESGSSSPGQISMGQFEIGGNYTLFHESTTERAAIEDQTQRAMVISITGGTIGASTTEEIYIAIPQFHLTDRGVDTAPAGFVTENPTFVGDYHPTYGSIIVKIMNGTSAYEGCVNSSSSSSSSFSSSSFSSCSSCSSSFSSSCSSFSSSSSS